MGNASNRVNRSAGDADVLQKEVCALRSEMTTFKSEIMSDMAEVKKLLMAMSAAGSAPEMRSADSKAVVYGAKGEWGAVRQTSHKNLV